MLRAAKVTNGGINCPLTNVQKAVKSKPIPTNDSKMRKRLRKTGAGLQNISLLSISKRSVQDPLTPITKANNSLLK